ncbi:oligosaccharide flippase family protein [Anaerotruncus rubiinfantis]|uniref:oligosaccharide flippase family protein n=1 Tax=Anaerotruncus rubiinfantis TaxID=1720200 RepID=UPI0011CC0E42|nr:oligosaccharide flippase family protein [Anaerotruncus rubiinfantis]
MDKYKKLISNTFIFAVGTFSSKVLVFLLMPLYTRVLTPEDYGVVNLIVDTANLIIPLVSVGISTAIIRFGLDRAVDKRDVFSGGIIVLGVGYLIFFLLGPFIGKLPNMQEHTHLIYLYVLTSCLRSLCSQFVRAKEYVRLYAFDGVLSTIMVIVFNVLLLVVFKLGITGYVLATILSDLLSAVFLFTAARLHHYIRFKGIDWLVLRSMLRYCIPLIPNTISWWITNVSGRYIVVYFLGKAANGLYAAAYKVPTMINLVSGIFTDAWQLSAFTESGPGRDRFFSNVCAAYQAIIFSAASGLILFAKFIMTLLVAKNYYEAWRFIPFLVLATSFSCFVTFLGSIYMVEKKSNATMVTTMIGAAVNVALCFLLIPHFGVNGAGFACFFSYFVVFIVRAVDTHKYVKIRWNLPKVALNLAALLIQSWVLLTVTESWVLPEVLLCLFVLLINFKQILINIQKILAKRR